MFLKLAESVIACLDRESARRLVRLTIPDDVARRLAELARKDQLRQLTVEEAHEYEFDLVALHFVEALKQKGRAALRRPKSQSSPIID
jgi:hypothetical protein